MRISDWSSDVCSSDLPGRTQIRADDDRLLSFGGTKVQPRYRREKFLQQLAVTRLCTRRQPQRGLGFDLAEHRYGAFARLHRLQFEYDRELALERAGDHIGVEQVFHQRGPGPRSEGHTSELQSLTRNSYA